MELEVAVTIGGIGAAAGLLAGFFAGADTLIGSLLMGVVGGFTLSAAIRIAGGPAIMEVGDGFSMVWAGVGGLILGWVVGRAN